MIFFSLELKKIFQLILSNAHIASFIWHNLLWLIWPKKTLFKMRRKVQPQIILIQNKPLPSAEQQPCAGMQRAGDGPTILCTGSRDERPPLHLHSCSSSAQQGERDGSMSRLHSPFHGPSCKVNHPGNSIPCHRSYSHLCPKILPPRFSWC